jgi:hypothetical protein
MVRRRAANERCSEHHVLFVFRNAVASSDCLCIKQTMGLSGMINNVPEAISHTFLRKCGANIPWILVLALTGIPNAGTGLPEKH